jgi:hypothetical protein
MFGGIRRGERRVHAERKMGYECRIEGPGMSAMEVGQV